MEDTVRKVQLDDPERQHLEKIVKQLRKRAEETVEYWVHSKLNLAEEDAEAPANLSAEERALRGRVEEAIEREQAGERSWDKARDLYVKGVGYTLVNRLAALRCMEVRSFLDRSPTRFRDDGVTPAADRLITDYFLPREAGIWTAFLVACQERSEEIEILFDLSDPYSLLYGDLTGWDGEPEEVVWSDDLQSSLVDLLQDLGGLLDEVEDTVWRADDVLGWVYEYYNVPDLEEVRSNVETKEDAIAANQFYTPHWVVRMLVDNSLGKLYLEHDGSLEEAVAHQEKRFTPEERKDRAPSMDDSPSVADLCSYLVPTEEEGEPTHTLAAEGPKGLKVFDPASGSAHFLLYAFDVLERIWRAETDVDHGKIPEKILEHNLYGVDLDLRACQLAAFNLYLKARSRAEEEGNENFQMPDLGIVCADAHVADLDRSHVVFDEVAGEDDELRDALDSILASFEHIEGLGSLLDVKGTLDELIEENGGQLDAFRDDDVVTLPQLLERLHDAVAQHVERGSFRAEDLRSFLRLLSILSQDYDVALMNPPYGSQTKMPSGVRSYVKQNYKYTAEYYASFFDVSCRLTKKEGRIGGLVPHTFMFNDSFTDFRADFTGDRGGFELFTELGYGVLDNSTVGTVATVINNHPNEIEKEGYFVGLSDTDSKEKEYVESIYNSEGSGRIYRRQLAKFRTVPTAPLSYWIPDEIKSLYGNKTVLDANQGRLPERSSVASVKTGLKTGKNKRFVRKFWEIDGNFEDWVPYPKGGKETWILPRIKLSVKWSEKGEQIKRYPGPTQGLGEVYFRGGITFNIEKRSGRRFGLMPEYSIFAHKSSAIFPDVDRFVLTGYLNSRFVTYLMLAQTSERRWSVGMVSRIPWMEELKASNIGQSVKRVAASKRALRASDFNSPYFEGALMYRLLSKDGSPIYPHGAHPHRGSLGDLEIPDLPSAELSDSVLELGKKATRFRRSMEMEIEQAAKSIDQEVLSRFGVSEEQKRHIFTEIAHRTIDDPRETSSYDPEAIGESPGEYRKLVERLLLHLTFEIVEEDDDGIVLLRAESGEEEADLLSKMTAKFEDIWGEYAEDRLQEVDEVLGTREPTDEPYPNLRHWLENDLFAFHCDEFENTPILWELTTERLGDEDNEDAGFACLIDYHQLGPDVFDRLSARYLETRKAALRERQQSARRTAEGSEGTQAREARQEEKRCENALRQIDKLETRISELTQTQPRDWASEVQEDARDLQPKVRRFRERLEERLETLDTLHDETSASWFKDRFAPKFMEAVNDNREEWMDALEDLEDACEQFARPADEPVEAHLYDLLPYFDKLTGSTHYASNGIFFLNYYFSKGLKLAANIDQGNTDRVTRREKLVADLARETEEDIELGKEINEACQAMKKHMDSDWKPRALEEVRTPGYRPVKKHGVAINITPLAEKKLVPELVEKKVL
jgi:hypothetical protein